MIDLLARLIDKSLLMADEGSTEARYRMLETIRDYAQERLAETGDASATYGRHRDWFVALVEQARPGFFAGAEQAAWLARLSETTTTCVRPCAGATRTRTVPARS